MSGAAEKDSPAALGSSRGFFSAFKPDAGNSSPAFIRMPRSNQADDPTIVSDCRVIGSRSLPACLPRLRFSQRSLWKLSGGVMPRSFRQSLIRSFRSHSLGCGVSHARLDGSGGCRLATGPAEDRDPAPARASASTAKITGATREKILGRRRSGPPSLLPPSRAWPAARSRPGRTSASGACRLCAGLLTRRCQLPPFPLRSPLDIW